MDRQREARDRYDRLKKALADEKNVRKKARRARMFGLCFIGAWVLGPAALYRVDLADVARPEFFRTPTPHEAHLLDLAHGDPGVREEKVAWEAASISVLRYPLEMSRSYREVGLFPEHPLALGIRIHVPAGQRLHVELEPSGMEGLSGPAGSGGLGEPNAANGDAFEALSGLDGPVFLDLFRAGPDPAILPARVQSDEWSGDTWVFDSDETADFVLRIQPALDEGGRYELTIRVGARWIFPVAGAGEEDIGGVFGDPRDGGRRQHHGVDIFKPRGTPVVAAADGVVSSVDTTEIGGRVVWLRESRGGHSLYYAHLETPLVEDGQRVQAGDTVGLIGNTGNARTTPPHLHFGAYRRGPRDPWSLILPQPPNPRPVTVSLSPLGLSGTSLTGPITLRLSPSSDARALAEVDGGTDFTILGATYGWYRAVLADGTTGFLRGDMTLAAPAGTPGAG